jgi:O-antigen/teichoic acid export membrane protein
MRRTRRVFFNAALSVLQVAVNGGLYLVLYRFLYDTVGVELLGVWSVVLAWTSVNNVANLGLGGSTTYYVPKYLARGERGYVVQLTQTGVLTVAAAVSAGVVVFYPLVRGLLRFVIPDPPLLGAAFEIVPYAFASLWLTATAGVVYSAIDGFQRVDLRNVILMAGAAVFLGAALVLVPGRGLVGLAQAQLAQAATVLVASWVVLRRLLPELPVLPVRWSRRAFSEMIGYSLRFQVISVTLLLSEPLTKSLLAKFGTVSAAGFFEMANRLALQLRAFIVTAHVALVPTLTDIGETAPARLRGIYEASCQLVAFLVALALPLLVALAPLISVVWIGDYEPAFVLFATLLFVGWFGNIVGNPAYFGYMGAGDLRWNVRSHVLTAALNAGLGVAAGVLFGGVGVVVGFTVALLAGSLLMVGAYGREHGVPLSLWAAPANLRLGAAALAGMGAVLFGFYRWGGALSVVALVGGSLALYALAVAGPLWLHPARRQLHTWARQAVASLDARRA